MNMTVEQLLNQLEKPENADQIKHLANLKNLEHVENVKEIGGLAGVLARFIMKFTQKHMDAFIILSECEKAADIAEFKKTKHYEKIKNSVLGTGHDLKNLEQLSELENLKNISE
jgi:predicted ATP-grasp superfamily ATP-dependent carboligase